MVESKQEVSPHWRSRAGRHEEVQLACSITDRMTFQSVLFILRTFSSTIRLPLRHGYPFKVPSKVPDQSRHSLRLIYLLRPNAPRDGVHWKCHSGTISPGCLWKSAGGDSAGRNIVQRAAVTWRPSAVWSSLTWKMYTQLFYLYASPVIFVSSSTWTRRPDRNFILLNQCQSSSFDRFSGVGVIKTTDVSFTSQTRGESFF